MWRKFSGNGRLPFGECHLRDWRRDETKKVVGSHPLLVPWTASGPPARHVVAATRCRHSHSNSTWWIRNLATRQQQQTTPTVLVDDAPTVPSPLLLPPAPPTPPSSLHRRHGVQYCLSAAITELSASPDAHWRLRVTESFRRSDRRRRENKN